MSATSKSNLNTRNVFARTSLPRKYIAMAFNFPLLAERESSPSIMTPHHPQTRHHPFPTAHTNYPPRPQPPPFRRRGSTLSSITSTSTAGSASSNPNYTTSSSAAPAPPLSPGAGRTPGALVWINGFPGVGKLTIAQWLHRLLGTDRSVIVDHQSQLAHSNGGGAAMLPPTPEVEITDPFFSMPGTTPASGGPGRGRRTSGKSSLPELISRPENTHKIMIVTSCVLSNPAPSPCSQEEKRQGAEGGAKREGSEEVAVSAAKECRETSDALGRPFVPVYLMCQEEENMRRVQSLERRYSSSSSLPGAPSPSSPSAPTSRPPLSYPSPPTSRDRVNRAGLARALREGRELFLFEGVKGLDLNVTELEAHEAAMEILGHVNAEMEAWEAKRGV